MKYQELKSLLLRLFKQYVKKHIKNILIALVLSIIVAGSTSGIAWLLDPAVKKIFIEQDRTLAWFIPLMIIVAFGHIFNDFSIDSSTDLVSKKSYIGS